MKVGDTAIAIIARGRFYYVKITYEYSARSYKCLVLKTINDTSTYEVDESFITEIDNIFTDNKELIKEIFIRIKNENDKSRR